MYMKLADKAGRLKEQRRRFDDEVSLLYKIEPFWQACQKCPDGYCCAHEIFPVLQSAGNPFKAEEWWLMLEYVRDNFSPDEKRQLVQNILSKRKDCVFLFGNRCGVHPARPWACRVHPYTISFHHNPAVFPVGELALPACPALAASFDIKKDELVVQRPKVLARYKEGHLVQIKLRKHKPLWLIDATDYVKEYERHIPLKKERPLSDWEELLALAGEAGGKEGDVITRYLEIVQGITRLPDGRIGF